MGLQENPLRSAMALTQKPRRPTDTDGMQVGLAWLILTNDKRPICWHNGGTGGYHSFIAFQEAAKTGIVVLTNGTQDVDDIGLHFLLPSVPLADYSAPARRMVKPVAVALLPGERLPTGEALFDRAIQQLGGRGDGEDPEPANRGGDKMAVFGIGIKGSMITYQVRPDQTYTKTEVRGLISAEEGSNGAIAWEVNSVEGAESSPGGRKRSSVSPTRSIWPSARNSIGHSSVRESSRSKDKRVTRSSARPRITPFPLPGTLPPIQDGRWERNTFLNGVARRCPSRNGTAISGRWIRSCIPLRPGNLWRGRVPPSIRASNALSLTIDPRRTV